MYILCIYHMCSYILSHIYICYMYICYMYIHHISDTYCTYIHYIISHIYYIYYIYIVYYIYLHIRVQDHMLTTVCHLEMPVLSRYDAASDAVTPSGLGRYDPTSSDSSQYDSGKLSCTCGLCWKTRDRVKLSANGET